MIVDCAVANGYPEASCVLVYREYGNTTLTVRDYSQFSQLSITLSVDKPENYTFAIFGKNGVSEMEEHPAYIVKLSSQLPLPGTYGMVMPINIAVIDYLSLTHVLLSSSISIFCAMYQLSSCINISFYCRCE